MMSHSPAAGITASLAPLILAAAPAIGVQDPPAQDAPTLSAAVKDVEARLRTDHYFQRARHEIVECPPFVLFIELPRRPDIHHVEEVRELYAPWLTKLGEIFRADYAEPLALRRKRKKQSLLPVCVVESRRGFVNLQRRARPGGRFPEDVCVIDAIDAIVTYKDSFSGGRLPHEKRTPVLYQAMYELLYAHYGGVQEKPAEKWYIEGLLGYFTSHEDDDAAILDHPMPSSRVVNEITELAANEALRQGQFLGVRDLIAPRSEKQIQTIYKKCAQAANISVPAPETAVRLFAGQSTMFMHFLNHGEGGKYRAGVRGYLTHVLADTGGEEPFLAALNTDIAHLDSQFGNYLTRLAAGESLESVMGVTVEAAAAIHPELIYTARTAEGRLAAAVGRARSGDYEGAIEALEVALEKDGDGADRERIERELARLHALVAARDSYFESLAGGTKKVRIETGEGTTAGRVKSLADGVLTITVKRDVELELPITDVSPETLNKIVGKKVSNFGEPWVLAFLRLLAGHDDWDKGLPQASEPGNLLREDAGADLERLVRYGHAIERLHEWAMIEMPENTRDRKKLFRAVTELALDYRDVPPVEERQSQLRDFAARLLGAVFDAEGLSGILNGDVKYLEDGVVRITYDFDSAKETEDFTKVVGYLDHRRADRFKLKQTEEESSFAQKGGNFEGRGAVCYRYLLEFEAPLKLEYELLYGRARPGKGMLANFLMGICDDGEGNYVGCFDLYDLEVINEPTAYVVTNYHEGERPIQAAKTYKITLRHDGESKVTLEVGGELQREINCGPLRSGGIFFWVHSEISVALKRLVIEGKVSAEHQSKARESWIAAELLDAGFPE